jgi:hypothetical protein
VSKQCVAARASQGALYSPARALIDAVPEKGAPKYDFLRQLLRGLIAADTATPAYDIVWDLLHAYQRKAADVAAAAGARTCRHGVHAEMTTWPHHAE